MSVKMRIKKCCEQVLKIYSEIIITTNRKKSNSNGHTLFLHQVNSNNPEVGDCSQSNRVQGRGSLTATHMARIFLN